MGKKRPIGYITPGGYKKTKDGWVKVRKIAGIKRRQTKKPKIVDFYGPGKHKYFVSEAEKKDFMQRVSAGMIGGKTGRKIRTAERIKVGTTVTILGDRGTGKVVASHKEGTKPPYAFDVEVIDRNGKVRLYKNLSRNQVQKKELTKKQKVADRKKKKSLEMKTEARALQARDFDDSVKQQASDLLIANWDLFSKMTSKYYRQRVNAGFNADAFGFSEEDLKQEVFILLQNAAESFLTNPAKHERASFKNYVMSFLKSNLASKIAAAAGTGNHMRKDDKEQMYLWFYRDTLNEYRANYGKLPSDLEMVQILETKRKALPEKKGTGLLKKYTWTVEKVKNKKKMTKTTVSLEQAVENHRGGAEATTLLELLNDEDIEKIPGHLKVDPWMEAQKCTVRDGVKSAIYRMFPDQADRTILTRLYGLFVTEDSPQEVRSYAMGQTPAEVARVLNQIEAKRGSRKQWTSSLVESREFDLLQTLKTDEEFVRQMGDFVKADQMTSDTVWADAGLILYWIAIYDAITLAFRNTGIETFSVKDLDSEDDVDVRGENSTPVVMRL